MNILKFDDFNLCSIGDIEVPNNDSSYEEIIFTDISQRYYKKCIVKNDRLVGAILLGDKAEFAEFKMLIEGKIELSEKRFELLRAQNNKEPMIGKLVCSCNHVGAGNLAKEIQAGCTNFNELCTVTGAGFFGSRQDIIFPDVKAETPSTVLSAEQHFVTEKEYKNIVSSYVSTDIFRGMSWLKGSTYLYILESFNHDPKLEVNITDPRQQLVPLFTGQLNFIASEEEDYWYLYLRLPQWEGIFSYPVLIYTWDIAQIAETIESVYEEVNDIDELFEEVSNEVETNNRTISKFKKIYCQEF